MKTVNFYTSDEGKTPVIEFLDSLTAKQAQKVTWVLQLVEELEVIPTTYLKKLVNTEEIKLAEQRRRDYLRRKKQ